MANPPPPDFRHPSFAGLIGVAREDITPPLGIYSRNWGAAKHDVADSVHRALYVTALALRERADAPPLVLIAADIGWWRRMEDEWFVRGALLEALKLDPARLLINTSHTHSGPSVCPEDAKYPGRHLVDPYLKRG